MAKKNYIVEIKESYTVRVAIRAEDEDSAYELADAFVNDGGVDPVKLVLDGGDYSRDCHVVKTLKCGEVLPEGVHAFK